MLAAAVPANLSIGERNLDHIGPDATLEIHCCTEGYRLD
jgi:hypothetical protein